MGLQAPSGGGKTYSALLLAYGLINDWSKIAVIDTENHSADLYANLGNYQVLVLEQPFSPERYIQAIEICEKADIQAIIIDSISHEWEGAGGILDIHGAVMGNTFTNWSKVTPRHNGFVQKILQSNCHIIATIRSKQDYVLSEKNGKMVPEKVGLKGVTREELDYEFTFVLELDLKHQATATKDRTQLFMDKPSFMITPGAGKIIRTTMLNDWISFVMLLSASSTLSCAGFQVVPSHFSTCPLVAVCWAIFRGVTVVPLPVKVASVFTTSVCRSRRDI